MKAATRPVEKASMWITRARLAHGEYGGRDSAIPSGGGGKQTTDDAFGIQEEKVTGSSPQGKGGA